MNSDAMSHDPWEAWDAETTGPAGMKPRAKVQVGGMTLRVGDKVRLRPKASAGAPDLPLTGRIVTIEAIEEDNEGRLYLAVLPGTGSGQEHGRARHLFFGLDEVELLPQDVAG